MDIFELGMGTVYDKIDFLYEQCAKFIEKREAALFKGNIFLDKLYISVDRQVYTINWKVLKDRRNERLYAIGAADNYSGYVFHMDANYDPWLSYPEIGEALEGTNDEAKPHPFQRFARVWLPNEFMALYLKAKQKAEERKAKGIKPRKRRPYHDDEVDRVYARSRKLPDVERGDLIDENVTLPKHGVLIHTDYHFYGFFLYLKKLLSNTVNKLRFFLDQDSGIRGSCLAAFCEDILDRRCEAFYVQIAKGLTRWQRETEANQAQKELEAIMDLENLDRSSAILKMLFEALGNMDVRDYGDEWFRHPLPSSWEPRLQAHWITRHNEFEPEHEAWLHNKASLSGINSFFNSVRRRVAMLERGVHTASQPSKTWHANSPYDPVRVSKILLIYRVYYNYVPRHDKKNKPTPAMKLGLADAPVDPEDIIYGQPMAFSRKATLARVLDPGTILPIDLRPEPEPDAMPRVIKKLAPVTHKPVVDAPYVFVDLETTGKFDDKDVLSPPPQIVEVAVIDDQGEKLFYSLIRPTCAITPGAYDTHHLTEDDLQGSPLYDDALVDQIVEVVKGKNLVAYNVDFDLRLLGPRVENALAGAYCCMKRYAEYDGTTDASGRYVWRSLEAVTKRIGYVWPGQMHRAIPDALACKAVWDYMRNNPKDDQSTAKVPEKNLTACGPPSHTDEPVQPSPVSSLPDLGQTQCPEVPTPEPSGGAVVATMPSLGPSIIEPDPQSLKAQTAGRNIVYLKTQTTGRGDNDQVVEIAIIDEDGNPLLDEYVRPTRPIAPDATAMHGITEAQLADKPSFAEIEGRVVEAIRGKHVVVFNEAFEEKRFTEAMRNARAGCICCMEKYWTFRNRTRQLRKGEGTLEAAAAYFKFSWPEPRRRAAHAALAIRHIHQGLRACGGISMLDDVYGDAAPDNNAP
jgi:DNA polymerase III epsilon subunit-like protein